MGPFAQEFTRQTWASAKARQIWEPLIRNASEAWLDAEVLSVFSGYREAALTFDLARIERYKLPYTPVTANRFAVGPLHRELAEAFHRRDDDDVGRLLRFPACCRTFFDQTWGVGLQDTTWEMSEGKTEHAIVSGPIECNILGRWIGIRLVPHLPCSFHCQNTINAGLAYHRLVQELDPLSADVIKEVLSWPVEWSALHGLAEIKYPVVKAISRTTYTAKKQTVQRKGTSYPKEGAKGVTFPYVDNEESKPVEFRKPLHVENGFTTATAMDKSHNMVLKALAEGEVQSVLDLGCGNGLLMDKIFHMLNVPVHGIEADISKTHRHPKIIVGDVKYADQLIRGFSIHTVIVSQRRFEEIPGLEDWCRSMPRTIVYSYDEPMFARDL